MTWNISIYHFNPTCQFTSNKRHYTGNYSALSLINNEGFQFKYPYETEKNNNNMQVLFMWIAPSLPKISLDMNEDMKLYM